MKTIDSPRNIELLLHCHLCYGKPIPGLEQDEHGALREVVHDLVIIGAIERIEGYRYQTTPRGRAWVQALCNVPPPQSAWLDEAGRVIC